LLLATLPALLFLIVWSIGANSYSQGQVASAIQAQTGETAHIATTLVNSLANGLTLLDGDQAANPPKTMAELNPLLEAKGITLASGHARLHDPDRCRGQCQQGELGWIGGIATLILSLLGAGYGLSQIAVRARARHKVEKVMLGSLFFASTLAIVTTIGIVLSMLFQTITFFGQVSPWNFFFGTVWDPRFAAAGSGGSRPVRPGSRCSPARSTSRWWRCWWPCRSG
jgi:phosphate transport system permease protein